MTQTQLYSQTVQNQQSLEQSIKMLADKQKEAMKYRDEFERQRNRCKHLANQLTTYLQENEKLKEENYGLYKQLAEAGKLDNDPKFGNSEVVTTEMQNLKNIIIQQQKTIELMRYRMPASPKRSDELPGAEKVRLTEEVCGLRDQVRELGDFKLQVDYLTRERDSLCNRVMELGKLQDENFYLRLTINQLKANKSQIQMQESLTDHGTDIEKYKQAVLALQVTCNSQKQELIAYRSKVFENVLITHYKEVVETLEEELDRLCGML